MNEQQCGNCRFLCKGDKCCKYPPFNNVWPTVEASDWCGMWEPAVLTPPASEYGDTD